MSDWQIWSLCFHVSPLDGSEPLNSGPYCSEWGIVLKKGLSVVCSDSTQLHLRNNHKNIQYNRDKQEVIWAAQVPDWASGFRCTNSWNKPVSRQLNSLVPKPWYNIYSMRGIYSCWPVILLRHKGTKQVTKLLILFIFLWNNNSGQVILSS